MTFCGQSIMQSLEVMDMQTGNHCQSPGCLIHQTYYCSQLEYCLSCSLWCFAIQCLYDISTVLLHGFMCLAVAEVLSDSHGIVILCVCDYVSYSWFNCLSWWVMSLSSRCEVLLVSDLTWLAVSHCMQEHIYLPFLSWHIHRALNWLTAIIASICQKWTLLVCSTNLKSFHYWDICYDKHIWMLLLTLCSQDLDL